MARRSSTVPRNGWTPTEAGNVYLKSAREILQIRHETDKRLQDLVNARRGTLTVGITSEHGSSMFTHIYPLFHRDYPEITISIYENSVRDQQQMLPKRRTGPGLSHLIGRPAHR